MKRLLPAYRIAAALKSIGKTHWLLVMGVAFLSAALVGAGLLSWRFGRELYASRYLDRLFASLHADSALIAALRDQNERLGSIDEEWTANQDRIWRTERLCGGGDLQPAVIRRPASQRLRQLVDSSGGLISHALLIDAKGRVAAEPYPSYNFDQAKKPKFYYTFSRGEGARDVSWLERSADDSHIVCWRSETMVDPISRSPIGVLALEVNSSKVGVFGCSEEPIHSENERATNRVDDGHP